MRAFYPWPGGYTTWRGKQLKITGAMACPEEAATTAGKVLSPSPHRAGFAVATGAGTLVASRVQMEGKKEMTAAEFLKGQRDFIGAVLPN